MAVESYKSQMILRNIKIVDLAGKSCRALNADQEYVIVVSTEAVKETPNVTVGWVIKNAEGVSIYGTSTAVQGKLFDYRAGEIKETRFSFRPRLALGTYYLSGGVAETLTPEDEIMNYVMKDYVHDALSFVVGSDVDKGIAKITSYLVSFQKVD